MELREREREREGKTEKKEIGKGGWLDWCGLDLVSESLCYTQ